MQIDHGGLAGLSDNDHPQYHLVSSGSVFIPLATYLTSTSFDGDSFSSVSKTLIDLSAVFGVPAGVKAVYVEIGTRDSASSSTQYLGFGISPNNTAGVYGFWSGCSGMPNDFWHWEHGICACDANGDIYYQTNASGTNTLDVYLRIHGYWI